MQGTLGWADYPPQHARELRDARPAEHTAHLIDDDGVTPIRFVRAGGAYTNAEEITLRPGAVLDLGKGWTVSTHGYPGAMTDDPISMRIVGEPFD
jgi:hypothetical protein